MLVAPAEPDTDISPPPTGRQAHHRPGSHGGLYRPGRGALPIVRGRKRGAALERAAGDLHHHHSADHTSPFTTVDANVIVQREAARLPHVRHLGMRGRRPATKPHRFSRASAASERENEHDATQGGIYDHVPPPDGNITAA